MLQSITVRNIATYDGDGIAIPDLQKVNFIYGANGSGKTTITKVIGQPDEPCYAHCAINWRGSIPLKSQVYNKDFRDKNFGKGTIDGVFTLGQATKEDIEAIAKMQEELASLRESLIKGKNILEKLKGDKEQHEAEYRESAWKEIYKAYEHCYKDAFVGVIRKDLFKERILKEFRGNVSDLKTHDVLSRNSETIFGEMPISISPITIPLYDDVIEVEKNAIWVKKVIGKADVEIGRLIQKLNLNDWVNEGRKHLGEGETCPFCQEETITENFRQQLENYFDETFEAESLIIKNQSAEYGRLSQNLENLFTQIETTEKANPNSKLDVETFSALLKTLVSQFISNREIIKSKGKEPSQSLTLLSIEPQLEAIKKLIEKANTAIAKHNNIVNNYGAARAELINCIWKCLAEENRVKIEAYQKKSDGMQAGIDKNHADFKILKEKYLKKEEEIREANKNVTSVQPSVDEINRTLKAYGFLNFQIVPSETQNNQYQILREDGTIAESTLSEGEVTFITFLYFLQLAKGSTSEDSITEDRILVIDDPICSLDSNVLFVVSALLKEIIKTIKSGTGHIKQLIILTHNVYFHKEVSFIDGRTKQNRDTHFWILRKNDNRTSIQSYNMQNPIQNSYQLLWQELKNSNNSGITVQNTMRRIIENYFKILGKYGDDDLINKFENPQEREICRSLICWINDGSHSVSDDLFVEQADSVNDRYFGVFKNIFTRMGHPEHYNMMMGEEQLDSASATNARGTAIVTGMEGAGIKVPVTQSNATL